MLLKIIHSHPNIGIRSLAIDIAAEAGKRTDFDGAIVELLRTPGTHPNVQEAAINALERWEAGIELLRAILADPSRHPSVRAAARAVLTNLATE